MAENWFKRFLTLPVNGPEHEELRKTLWIGGAENVCAYYVGMLTKRNVAALPIERKRLEIRQFVLNLLPSESIAFLQDAAYVSFIAAPLLKTRFNETFGLVNQASKEERALVFLLTHPDWSDESIRRALKTTSKQMKRWSTYQLARSEQRRFLQDSK